MFVGVSYLVFPVRAFAQTKQVIESGIVEGLHLGAQLYVSKRGEVLIDTAFGQAREGVAMTPDSLTLWFSAGKPLTAAAIAQLVERGALGWNTRVAELLPAFAAGGKETITVQHILTHTAGLHAADDIELLSWPDTIERISATPLPAGWIPGERAAYSSRAGWFILGEIIRLVTGHPVERHLETSLFRPCEMPDTRLSFSPDEIGRLLPRTGFIYDTKDDSAGASARPISEWNDAEGLERCVPGGSARGPVRELGRFYEALLACRSGRTMPERVRCSDLLDPATIEGMTARQRTGIFDETFQYKLDCGLGFILNSNRDGLQMPYGYGRAASPETFGHSGNQSSCAFADPARELVVAWACNGMPGERRHQKRQRAINNAIYEDLEA